MDAHPEAHAVPVRPSAHYRAVVNAILSLPREYQAPLFLRYVERTPYAEIAGKCAVPHDVAAQLIYQGTLMLQAELAHLISTTSHEQRA